MSATFDGRFKGFGEFDEFSGFGEFDEFGGFGVISLCMPCGHWGQVLSVYSRDLVSGTPCIHLCAYPRIHVSIYPRIHVLIGTRRTNWVFVGSSAFANCQHPVRMRKPP